MNINDNANDSIIDGFLDKDFVFMGGYCFENLKNDFCFLLGKNGCAIILSKQLICCIKERTLDDNLKFKLIQHGLAFVPGKSLPQDEFECMKELGIHNSSVSVLIDIAEKCNYKCIYCFRNLRDNKIIDSRTLADACSFIENVCTDINQNTIGIQLWGGEPLLSFESIRLVYNRFCNSRINVHIDIETNASLITDEMAAELKEMGIGVGVSIDGLPQHHNRTRPTKSGEDSSALTVNGIKTLKKYYGDDLGGITVVSRYNFKDIDSIIEYFIYSLGIRNIKFNIVRENPNSPDNSVGLNDEEIAWFAEKLCDTVFAYNDLGIRFDEGNLCTMMKNLTKRENSNFCISNGCKGGYALFSIDAEGYVYPCELTDYKEYRMGSIYENGCVGDGKLLESMIILSKKSNPYFKPKDLSGCKECPWLYYCKGGCTSSILYSGGDAPIDKGSCIFNRTVYPKLISRLLERKELFD